MIKLPDVDIDTKSDFDLGVFDCVQASRIHNRKLLVHPSGCYFDNIPADEVTGLAAIPFREANELGYFKVDFLHNTIYDAFESRDEVKALMNIEPDWSMLEKPTMIRQLTQIHSQERVVMAVQPTSINDLADVLALIRPAKRALLQPYIRNQISRDELYTTSDTGYQFRKSHSVAYACVVALHMHVIARSACD